MIFIPPLICSRQPYLPSLGAIAYSCATSLPEKTIEERDFYDGNTAGTPHCRVRIWTGGASRVGWLNRLRGDGDGSPVLIVICVDSLETQPRLR